MTYDFDKYVNRRGTDSLKWDALTERYGRDDVISLWVADMDFETPPFIVDALKQRLTHPVFGYTKEPETYWPTVVDWVLKQHGWKVKPEWLTYIPGIVKGIGMAINVFVAHDEKVIIQPPVYHPFRLVPQYNGRQVVMNPLIEQPDHTYRMDFEHLESVIDDKCRMLVLCNPHNPGGIIWDADTLRRLATICSRHGLIVISDEIHCDMALYGHRHIPFACVSDEAAQCSITFAAPSKTFNMAGLVSSYAVVPNDSLRRRFFTWLEANELNEPDIFAPIATIAAFSQGDEWRKQMLRYIEGNVDFVIDYCARCLPQVKPWRPQASFLIWLDCRDLHLDHEQLVDLFLNRARLALNDGEMFGIGGEGFMRMNVGTTRDVLRQAMDRLREAVEAEKVLK